MKCLKNPMTNAFYLALITAIYAAILIISSEFIQHYVTMLSDSQWAAFIVNGNLKYVALFMIGIAFFIDLLSALRRKKFDEYQTTILQKVLIFNGIFSSVLFPLSVSILVFIPTHFVEMIFAFMIVQWSIVAMIDVIYLFKNY